MSYNILTETAFFKVINNLGGKMEMDQIQEEYHQFVTQVIDLCHRASESKEALHALVFAETELQYHPLLRSIPAPAPFPATFFTGQPKLISITSGFACSTILAASTMSSVVLP